MTHTNETCIYIRIAHDCQSVSWFTPVPANKGVDIRLTLVDGKITEAKVVEEN